MEVVSRQELGYSKLLKDNKLAKLAIDQLADGVDHFVVSVSEDDLLSIFLCKEDVVQGALLIRRTRVTYGQTEGREYLYHVPLSGAGISIYSMDNQELKALFPVTVEVVEEDPGHARYECMADTPLSLTLSVLNDGRRRAMLVNGQLGCASGFSSASPAARVAAGLLHADFFGAALLPYLLEQLTEAATQPQDLLEALRSDPIVLANIQILKSAHSKEDAVAELLRYLGPDPLFSGDDLHDIPSYIAALFELHGYEDFDLARRGKLILATAKQEIRGATDQRLLGLGLVGPQIDHHALESSLNAQLDAMEQEQKETSSYFNCIHLRILPDLKETTRNLHEEFRELLEKQLYRMYHLGLDTAVLSYTLDGQPQHIVATGMLGAKLNIEQLDSNPVLLAAATKIEQRELQVRARGGVWAYRIPVMLQAALAEFHRRDLKREQQPTELRFTELDLDYQRTVIQPRTGSIDYNHGELIPVKRPLGANEAGVVIGIIEADLGLAAPVERLLIIGDLSHSSRGAVRAQECVRINAAIRFASKHQMPIDWFAASFGVQIHHERGVEGLDAAASTLREIVEHCHHRSLQINLVVDSANIGAQSYWDSMAAIVFQSSGILIMTPKGSMALTGAKSLACALFGTVNSEDINAYVTKLYPDGLQSLSGYAQVHGPNSESMIQAASIEQACYQIIQHHYYSYLTPGELLCTRRMLTPKTEPACSDPQALEDAMDAFLTGQKPDRELVIDALRDADAPAPLRLWSDVVGICQQELTAGDLPQKASAIVQELLIDGHPTLLIFTPTGPLTPADSNVIARAIHKASGRMQVLLIGSLSGFSCDPLSMSNRQLQEGALIAKAIIEHQGPLLIVNLGCLVGGTFVVFNKQLSPNLRILAAEGARVQVIGGKSAAKVVFHSHICRQADQDTRVLKGARRVTPDATTSKIQEVSARSMGLLRSAVIEEIEDAEAERFDRFHNARRALKVGSIDGIVSPSELRQEVISYFDEMRLEYRLRKQREGDT